MNRRLFPALLAVLILVLPLRAEDPQPGSPYRITWKYFEHFEPAPGNGGLPYDREYQWLMDYRHIHKGAVVSSAVDRVNLSSHMNGGSGQMVTLDQDTYFNEILQTRRTTTITRKDQPALFEPMGKPLLDVKVDDEGAELGRDSKVKIDGQVSSSVINRTIDMTRLFHPAFPHKKEEWESPVTFTFRARDVVKGKLRYKKLSEKNLIVKVAVEGRLVAKNTGGLDLQGTFDLTGVQSFDLRRNVWVDGQLDMRMEMKEASVWGYSTWTAPITMTLVSGAGVIKPAKP